MTQEFPIERKLTAVLSADVEGFSRLMEADEVGTLQNLAGQRRILDEVIARYRGRVVNTAGDSVLAEFPSVADAVQCAVDTQKAHAEAADRLPGPKRVLFRIGIHLGDVAVRGSDLLGNGVNIAARLQSMAAAGGIVISSSAHDQVRKILPLTYSDLGTQNVKNIEEPVRAFAIQLSRDSSPMAAVLVPPAGKSLPLPDKPSIAVLPFQNMSGDPEQEYFADGMVEDIITALSRFKSLFVIARNSSFTYKGKAIDIKQVGRELGVRYVLEGSVRKAGGRMRITGQLIEAATSAHVWADKFDGVLDDVFELQDQVTSSVAGTIGSRIELAEIERSHRKPIENLDAYDCYLQGIALLNLRTLTHVQRALELFYRAIAIDSSFSTAYGMGVRSFVQLNTLRALSVDELEEAQRLAAQAIALGQDDPLALAWSAQAAGLLSREVEKADALANQALSLNANLGEAWQLRALISVWMGRHDDAVVQATQAIRRDPHNQETLQAETALAQAHFFKGHLDEALGWAMRAVARRPFLPAYRVLVATLVCLDRMDDARLALAQMREFGLPARISQSFGPFRANDLEKMVQALRAAGLPE